MNFNKTEPIYIQISHDIMRMIFTKEIGVGSKLNGVRELAKKYNVTPKTIQNATDYLVELNVVIKNQGISMTITNNQNDIEKAKIVLVNKIKEEYNEKLKALGINDSLKEVD